MEITFGQILLVIGLSPSDYMRICLAMIDTAAAIYFLSDWADSAGAIIEQSCAAYTDKQCIFEEAA